MASGTPERSPDRVAEQLHYVDDFAGARAVLESVLALDPGRRDSVILMGDIAVHEANWPAALEWTARARELFPNSADARLDRIDALTGNGSRDEALAEITDRLTSVATSERGLHRHARSIAGGCLCRPARCR